MPAWFYNLPVFDALFLLYAVFSCFSILGFIVSRKFVRDSRNLPIITAVQHTCLTFGTLFMAFWIAINWQTLDQLRFASQSEAHQIFNLYSSTKSLQNQESKKLIRSSIVQYLDDVVNKEYNSLDQGYINQTTERDFEHLMEVVYNNAPTKTIQDVMVYNQLVGVLHQLSDARVKRMDFVVGELNGVLLIFFLALLSVICFWNGWVKTSYMKLTIIVLLSQNLIILSSGWLILEIDRPFQGFFKVDNTAFVATKSDILQLNSNE